MFENKNNIKNPFAEKCENCTTDMWEYLQNKQKEVLKKNTYVKIEKFIDDG